MTTTIERQVDALERLAIEQFSARVLAEVTRQPQVVGQAIARRLRSVCNARHDYASNDVLMAAVIAAIRAEAPACADRIEAPSEDTSATRSGT